MIQEMGYLLRVVFACMKKDIKCTLNERSSILQGILIPINFLILLSLFVLADSYAPAAVVMEEHGPYAQGFYLAMEQTHSFHLRRTGRREAEELLRAGRVVAIVTIPPDFDLHMARNQEVHVGVKINNLNTDLSGDIRRAVPLAITLFYAQASPHLVAMSASEHDVHAQDTDDIPYLSVPIFVLALALAGIMQAGSCTAREWEMETIKEILLSPANRGGVLLGKMLAALVMSLCSVVIVLLLLLFGVGISPAHWDEVIALTLLCLLVFMAWGVLCGTLFKHRLSVLACGLGISMPLFFVSGAFGPLVLASGGIQFLAKLLPMYYAIVLQQHAFRDFVLSAYSLDLNALVLCCYGLSLFLLATLLLQRSTIAH